jgi:hypothetical protein
MSKTAMQELIDKIQYSIDVQSGVSLIETLTETQVNTLKAVMLVAERLLEKEKEQIIYAGNACSLKTIVYREKIDKMSKDELRSSLVEDTISYGEEYYNQTYNQTNVGNDGFEFDNSSTIPPPKTNNL